MRILTAVLVLAAAPFTTAAPAAAQTGAAAQFAGTYSLVTIEAKDPATGRWSARPDFNSNGYIIYAPTGQMAVHIQPKVRSKYAGATPTAEEAAAAMRGYTMYFGGYTVNGNEQFVVHHRVGNVNPGAVVDAKRYFEFVTTPQGRERLILTPAPGNTGPKAQATTRLIWERQDAAPLSAEQEKFVGFYKLLYTDRYRTKDGRMVFHGDPSGKAGGRVTTQAGTSYIIYTDTGHMMVIQMNNSGRVKYAAAQPTPAEALAAWRSIGGYFGRFVTFENQNPPYVIHSQQGTSTPGAYSDQQRFYQFTGDVLRLGGPPRYDAETGELEGGHLYWQRMKAGEK
ncbi:MAG: lipocalin-like domain-containing protein [Acidobacteria bacterium]|nr:lipocalin-like domain-containing protein [Acidobacteriota bacterium]